MLELTDCPPLHPVLLWFWSKRKQVVHDRNSLSVAVDEHPLFYLDGPVGGTLVQFLGFQRARSSDGRLHAFFTAPVRCYCRIALIFVWGVFVRLRICACSPVRCCLLILPSR